MIAGINVLVFEFRGGPNAGYLSLRQIRDDGDQIMSPLVTVDGVQISTEGFFIFNATAPGTPVAVTGLYANSDGSLEFSFEGLAAGHVGTLVVRPMLPQLTDRTGRVCGGMQVTIPAI